MRVILHTYSGVQAEGHTLSRIVTFSLKASVYLPESLRRGRDSTIRWRDREDARLGDG